MKTKIIAKDSVVSRYWVWGLERVGHGPIDLLALVGAVKGHRVSADSWVFSERRRTWARAAAMEELEPLFEHFSHTKTGRAQSAIKAGVSAEVLDRVRLLAKLNGPQLQTFLQYLEIVNLEPLAYAVREGQHGSAMYLILEGELRVGLVRDGKETILATLKAGDFFGEVSVLDQGPRCADVIANERSTLLRISAASFEKLRREAPALAEHFLYALSKSLVGRLRAVNKRYHDSVLMLRVLE